MIMAGISIIMGRGLWLVLLLMALQVSAHPHSFIKMETTFEVRDQQLIGMEMTWNMDPITSADLLYDAGEAPPEAEIWKKLAAEVMANVLSQHYFTELYHNGQPVKFIDWPGKYHMRREGHSAILTFLLPLALPRPLTNSQFTLMTYDPTYFVDMTYANQRALIMPPTMKSLCQLNLVPPKPNGDLLAYAQALDKKDAPDEDIELGKQFAQKVEVQCH